MSATTSRLVCCSDALGQQQSLTRYSKAVLGNMAFLLRPKSAPMSAKSLSLSCSLDRSRRMCCRPSSCIADQFSLHFSLQEDGESTCFSS